MALLQNSCKVLLKVPRAPISPSYTADRGGVILILTMTLIVYAGETCSAHPSLRRGTLKGKLPVRGISGPRTSLATANQDSFLPALWKEAWRRRALLGARCHSVHLVARPARRSSILKHCRLARPRAGPVRPFWRGRCQRRGKLAGCPDWRPAVPHPDREQYLSRPALILPPFPVLPAE